MGEAGLSLDVDAFRRILEARRAELADLSSITADSRRPVALDQQSVGRLSRQDALQQQAMAAAQERRRKAELARLEAALRRIGEGEYGYCASCGEEIAEGRLKVDPAAERCVDCA